MQLSVFKEGDKKHILSVLSSGSPGESIANGWKHPFIGYGEQSADVSLLTKTWHSDAEIAYQHQLRH